MEKINPILVKASNIRDNASINELNVLSNLESYNAELIKEGIRRTSIIQKS